MSRGPTIKSPLRVAIRAALAIGVLTSTSAGLAAAEIHSPRSTSQKIVMTLSLKPVPVGQFVVADLHKSTLASGTSLRHLTISWGDGSKLVTLTSLSAIASHSFSRTGSFKVKATLTNSRNNVTTTTITEVASPARRVYWTTFNSGSVNYQDRKSVV